MCISYREYAHMHTQTHTYIHTCVHTYTQIQTCLHSYIYTDTHTFSVERPTNFLETIGSMAKNTRIGLLKMMSKSNDSSSANKRPSLLSKW